MSLVGFASNRGFGHWRRLRNYLTLPPLKDRAVLIAPMTLANLSWEVVNSVGYVDGGARMVLEEDGSLQTTVKYDSHLPYKPSVEGYYLIPWAHAYLHRARMLVVDAHNEPEIVYCDELFPQSADIVRLCREQGLRKVVFTLETQVFRKLPLRYRRAFEKVDILLVPYEKEFFAECVSLEPFEEFEDKMFYAGSVINPSIVKILRTPKTKAREMLKLPADKTVIFCTYGKGEGAQRIVEALVQIGDDFAAKHPGTHFIVSDPTGRFRQSMPSRPWLEFIGLDYQKAMMTMAACDCTIQGLGTSTLLEGLVAGKPMVAISLERPYEEQEAKGRGVEKFGLGEYLPISQVSPRSISNALQRVLEEGYGKKLRQALPRTLGNLKGAEKIADLLASILS
ncbi:hypothetical protein [Candidatus Hecatella orcuttiae]|uniref:hypothetical protein n=1 Tax=Candidatus Hecatella orcuttiae TaxID=1935119 RepID=UPI0028681AC9|nr:hypothetical protein [Candidatus Hecatella orcuttiae]